MKMKLPETKKGLQQFLGMAVLEYFRKFIKSFKILTDHQGLSFLKFIRKTNINTVLKWCLQLAELAFNIYHIKGTENVSDAMSRGEVMSSESRFYGPGWVLKFFPKSSQYPGLPRVLTDARVVGVQAEHRKSVSWHGVRSLSTEYPLDE